MSESLIASKWAELRTEGRAALIPYLTAGFPSIGESRTMLEAAHDHADIIEVGVPFSDPVADGPVIQASTFRALANGMTLPRTLELINATSGRRPIVLFSYLNPVLQYGVERLLADAASAGVSGILLTDLPANADSRIEHALEAGPLAPIRLIAPTTSSERLRHAVQGGRGFIYLVARLGVTGMSREVDSGLQASVERVRAATALPIAVGFGISTPAQARVVAAHADGVVVGSALVSALGTGGVKAAAQFLATMRDVLEPT